MDDFKRASQKAVGIGGIRCNCCFDYHGEKGIFRRLARRRMKQNDSDLQDGISEWEEMKKVLSIEL